MKPIVDMQDDAPGAEAPGGVYIAVVCGGSGVLGVEAAATLDGLAARLVGFLEPRIEYQLWEDAATQFRRLLQQDQPQRAIDLYFASVGERWDEERLTIVRRAGPHSPALPAAALRAMPERRPGRAASARRWAR